MANQTVSQNSYLSTRELLQLNGVLFWDQVDFPEIEETDEDQFVQLTSQQAERPDLIAHDFYGDAKLIWILLLANDKDYVNQFLQGETIRIPAKSTVDTLLSTTQK